MPTAVGVRKAAVAAGHRQRGRTGRATARQVGDGSERGSHSAVVARGRARRRAWGSQAVGAAVRYSGRLARSRQVPYLLRGVHSSFVAGMEGSGG